MKLIIDIPKKLYDRIVNNDWNTAITGFMCCAVAEGVSLPKGHGELIDRDYVLEWAEEVPSKYLYTNKMINVADIKAAPTIIEADKEEEE